MNDMWMKLTKLPPQREYKYAMKSALEIADVTMQNFKIELRKFQVTRTREQFLEECIKSGFAQKQFDIKKVGQWLLDC